MTEKKENILIPVSKWNEYYDYPTIGAIRQLIFYGNINGFNKVIRRINAKGNNNTGRLYISVPDFNDWLKEHGKIVNA